MSINPVTQAEYMKVMHINPSYFSRYGDGWRFVQQIETDNFPVESVPWDDAMDFCRRLSNMTIEREKGFTYRLPIEAEWEFACKAGTIPFLQMAIILHLMMPILMVTTHIILKLLVKQ